MRVIVLLLLLTVGCVQPKVTYIPDPVHPAPRADLPPELRLKNWIGRAVDGDSGGSCVHASTRMVFRTAGAYHLDRVWFENATRGYEGPETASRLLDKLHRQGVVFAATEDGDVRLLEEASRTNRWAVIFYYPSHAIAFCGFAVLDGQAVAVLLDNNFPDRYIIVEKNTFIRTWRDIYGGFACVPWNLTPCLSRTFPRTWTWR